MATISRTASCSAPCGSSPNTPSVLPASSSPMDRAVRPSWLPVRPQRALVEVDDREALTSSRLQRLQPKPGALRLLSGLKRGRPPLWSRAQTPPRGSDQYHRRKTVRVHTQTRPGGRLDRRRYWIPGPRIRRAVSPADGRGARRTQAHRGPVRRRSGAPGPNDPQAVGRLEQNAEPLAREQGQDMVQTIARADRLEEELEAMRSAGPLKRIYVLAKDFDPEIARHTLDNYEPAAPLSLEAVVAAGSAAICGWAATHLVAWPIGRVRLRRAAERPHWRA